MSRPDRRNQLRDLVPSRPGAEDRKEPDPSRSRQRITRAPVGDGRSADRAWARSPSTSGNQVDVPWVVLADPRATSSASSCAVNSWRRRVCSAPSCSSPPARPSAGSGVRRPGWPIVYDQDGDTAIRDPDGRGPFVTFGSSERHGQDRQEPPSFRRRADARRRPGGRSRAPHRARRRGGSISGKAMSPGSCWPTQKATNSAC